jgi:hypothetical protein
MWGFAGISFYYSSGSIGGFHSIAARLPHDSSIPADCRCDRRGLRPEFVGIDQLRRGPLISTGEHMPVQVRGDGDPRVSRSGARHLERQTRWWPIAIVGIILLVVALILGITWVDGNEAGYGLGAIALWRLGIVCLVIWYLGSQHDLRAQRHRELVGYLPRLVPNCDEPDFDDALDAGLVRVPNVVGKDYEKALGLLRLEGFYVTCQDASSRGRKPQNLESWTVVAQAPPPGPSAYGEEVSLRVLKVGE